MSRSNSLPFFNSYSSSSSSSSHSRHQSRIPASPLYRGGSSSSSATSTTRASSHTSHQSSSSASRSLAYLREETPPPSSPSSTYSSSSSYYQHQIQQLPSLPPTSMRLSGPREASLADALSRAHTPCDAIAALDEYAWRSLKAGIRVRDYCNAANRIVHHTPVCLLYPFDLPSGAPPSVGTPLTAPPATLPHLSRKQLSDTLARLMREKDEVLVKAQVLEATLEYVARRWREGDDNVVDSIAKKMAETEIELKSIPGASHTVIVELRRLRFQFGLTSRPQLISLLNCTNTTQTIDPTFAVTAWVVRRLSWGAEPKKLIPDLYNVRDNMLLQSHRDIVNSVVAAFVLDGRSAATQWTPEGARSRTRTLSRLSLRGTKRKTLGIPWLSRSKALDDERRPSLPTHLATAEISPSQWSRLGTFGASTTDFSPSFCSTPSTASTPPRYRHLGMSLNAMSTNTLGMSMNGMSTNSLGLTSEPATDVRAALADHLLVLRYRLGSDADGWYLGGGQEKAVDFLASLENKEETRDIVIELRKAFDIPMASTSRNFRPSAFHERDVSFDLDQYIADIGPQGDEDDHEVRINMYSPLRLASRKKSKNRLLSRASVTSIATTATTKSSASSHRVGEFSIMEATRVPLNVKEVAYRFPDKESDGDSLRTPTFPPKAAGLGILPVFSKSMTNLVESPPKLRRVAQRLTATPLLPAFKETPVDHSPTTQFPAMTPPLSPAVTDASTVLGGSTPSPPNSMKKITLALPVENEISPVASSERRSSPEHLRSRRQQFRQHVIVDGHHRSPDPKHRPLITDVNEDAHKEKEGTMLSTLLPLLSSATATEAQVEEKFTFAYEREVQRAFVRGESLDPEGRARLVWMLEQVANELPQPHLVAAAKRIIASISSPRPVAEMRTPPRQLPNAPQYSGRQKSPSPRRRDLAIVVPPRKAPRGIVLVSPDQPTSANTFGSHGTSDASAQTSPLITPRQTPPSTSDSTVEVMLPYNGMGMDDDRTPMQATHEKIATPTRRRLHDFGPVPPPSTPSSRRSSRSLLSAQSTHSAPSPSLASPRSNWSSSSSRPPTPMKVSAPPSPVKPSTPSLPRKLAPAQASPRPANFRKPVPPLPAMPALGRTSVTTTVPIAVREI